MRRFACDCAVVTSGWRTTKLCGQTIQKEILGDVGRADWGECSLLYCGTVRAGLDRFVREEAKGEWGEVGDRINRDSGRGRAQG